MKKWLILVFIVESIYCYSQNAIDNAISYYQNDRVAKYSTKNNEKAKGLVIDISIPTNFVRSEGIRPHILNNYKSQIDNEKGSVNISLQINDLSGELIMYSDEEVAEILFSEEIIKQSFKDQEILFNKQTKYEGQNGSITITYVRISRAGIDLYIISCIHRFIYNRELVSVNCTYGVSDEYTKNIDVKKQFVKFRLLNNFIGNSIILENKWSKKKITQLTMNALAIVARITINYSDKNAKENVA
jgi:hypothetical protein